MRSTCNRSLWIILLLISTQCVLVTKQDFLKQQQQEQQLQAVKELQLQFVQIQKQRPADIASKWSIEQQENLELISKQKLKVSLQQNENHSTEEENVLPSIDDNNEKLFKIQQHEEQLNKTKCAKTLLQHVATTTIASYTHSGISKSANSYTTIEKNNNNNNSKNNNNTKISTLKPYYNYILQHDSHNSTPAVSKIAAKKDVKLLKESFLAVDDADVDVDFDADADFTQNHKMKSIGNNNRKYTAGAAFTITATKRHKNQATKIKKTNKKIIKSRTAFFSTTTTFLSK